MPADRHCRELVVVMLLMLVQWTMVQSTHHPLATGAFNLRRLIPSQARYASVE
jgi:hypothetical protein